MSASPLADATIVFDLDGTLVDSAPDLLRALNQVMDLEGLPRAPESAVKAFVGHGARVLIEKAAGLQGALYQDGKLDQLTAAFIDFYRADIAGATKPYPHLEAALDTLAAAGARLLADASAASIDKTKPANGVAAAKNKSGEVKAAPSDSKPKSSSRKKKR